MLSCKCLHEKYLFFLLCVFIFIIIILILKVFFFTVELYIWFLEIWFKYFILHERWLQIRHILTYQNTKCKNSVSCIKMRCIWGLPLQKAKTEKGRLRVKMRQDMMRPPIYDFVLVLCQIFSLWKEFYSNQFHVNGLENSGQWLGYGPDWLKKK